MAKSKEKNKAIELRKRGESIRDIAKKLKVSKGTVSLWCRDIKLTLQQIKKLYERRRLGGYKGARTQYEQRLKRIEEYKKQGLKRIGNLSNRDLLLTGLALYWGEGSKKNRKIRINNSDPELIKFIIKWFKKVWNIEDVKFTFRAAINEIHQNRVEEVERYWSTITGFPLKYFYKTTLIKTKNKKNYRNFPKHYGTLTIEIKKSGQFYYQIMGLLEGLIR